MSALDHEPFPRGALIAAGALVGFSLVATTAVRLIRITAPPTPIAASQPAPAETADLRFSDEADGSIRVQNARTDQVVATIQPGVGGFVRGVMRGLARDRISRHIGETPPFRVSQALDGRMSLEDMATGRVIDLESFGSGNREAFIQLLRAPGAQAVTAQAVGAQAVGAKS
jgi:putative photosynthetic complex assembly protein